MSHLTKRTFPKILFLMLLVAMVLGLLLYLLLEYISLIAFPALIILSIPIFIIFIGSYSLLIIVLFCYGVRISTKIEGQFLCKYGREPRAWHDKMGYLRIIELLAPKELLVWVYGRCGASIGMNVVISGYISDPDLVEIGDNTFIGEGSQIFSHSIEKEIIHLNKIKIGRNCTIGSRSYIMPGVEIGDNVIIGAYTLVPKNKKLQENSVWIGLPARRIK